MDRPHHVQQQQKQQQQAETVVAVDALVRSIQKKIKHAAAGEPLRKSPPTIYRVHPSVREEHNRAYDPKIVSIGPFHHGKQNLQAMESLKLRYLHDLLARSLGKEKEEQLSKYIKVIRECEIQARERYSESIGLTTDEFVEMMVVDGCFIVEYFVKCAVGDEQDPLSEVNCAFSHLPNDLCLLENQIPFFILKNLFEKSTVPIPNTFLDLALHYLKIEKLSWPPCTEIYHLLHLLHMSLNPTTLVSDSFTFLSCIRLVLGAFRKLKNLISLFFCSIFFGILYIFISIFRVLTFRLPYFPCIYYLKSSRFPRMIPCATELQEAGINFKKKWLNSEREDCFLRVNFDDGTMAIPFLSVEEATNSKFRNLIAFEQCCPDVGNYFTSYAMFMDNIINTAGDVAILRRRGIIESKLGNDEEVATVFNRLCKGTHLDYKRHYLVGVFRDVTQYCGSARHRWRARLMHEYFNNPWAIISLIAAAILLILTATQTFFAVFSYFRPPLQH